MPKSKRQLKVVFDTSVLYTKSAAYLLSQDARKLIENNRSHADLTIEWYLPESVRHERQFQMNAAGRDLLPDVRKLEILLGHNLGITDEFVTDRVNTVVESQLKELDLIVLSPDASRVKWNELMLSAAYRKPPFEEDKGFRDALAMEAFDQLVADSPKAPSTCLLVLVSADGLMGSAAVSKWQAVSNVRLVPSLEELQGLISTLVAEVTEDYVEEIRVKSSNVFLDIDTKTGLYYSGKISEKIQAKFAGELRELPDGATSRENGQWWIESPVFNEKKGQIVHWSTRIRVEASAYVMHRSFGTSASRVDLSSNVLPNDYAFIPPQLSTSFILPQSTLYPSSFVGEEKVSETKIKVADGKSVFEILWTVQITTAQNLRKAQIADIKFIETKWE